MHSHMFKRLLGTTMAAAIIGLVLFTIAGFAQTPVASAHGCTPGYWKNHTENWGRTSFSPSQTVGNTFRIEVSPGNFISSPFVPSLRSLTLLQALQGGGGPDLAGAQQILLRAATSALLNAAGVPDYGLRTGDVTYLVNQALATNDRDQILALATRLDNLNNRVCPF
jgi:hypothetical protein